jgi:hypothetical protein
LPETGPYPRVAGAALNGENQAMTEPTSFAVEGGCACGTARYRLNARPMFVHCCHCTFCQHQSGAAFALNAMVEAANVTLLSGEVSQIKLPTRSGKGQVVTRCAACGIALWSNYAAAREKIHFVRVGTLDDSSVAPPDIHIFTSTKQPWVILPEGALVFAEFYDRPAVWPADSMARYSAAVSA